MIPEELTRGRILFDYVVEQAQDQPNASIAIFNGTHVSYQDMVTQVRVYANSLIASGMKPGDRLAHFGGPCPEFLVSFLATGLAGGIWMGLNPKYSQRELAYVLKDAQPRFIEVASSAQDKDIENIKSLSATMGIDFFITDAWQDENTQTMGYFLSQGATWSAADENKGFTWPELAARAPCMIVYTSGTTGHPKGALLPHQSVCYSGEYDAKGYVKGVEGPIRVINNLPINHVGCTVDICAPFIICGGTMVFMESFDTSEILRVIEEERISVLGAVPTMYQMMIDDPLFSSCDFSSVKYIVWSGAAMSEPMLKFWKERGMVLDTGYGLTETIGGVTSCGFNDDITTLASTIGQPTDPDNFRLMDDNGELVTDTLTHGEIQVRGVLTMLEYYNNPQATQENFTPDGWMHTGDVAQWTDNGYLQLVGRTKEMFKSGGYNVYPREIESVLERFPGVALSAVISVKDDLYGEVGHAFIVPMEELSELAIKQWCKEQLANYKVPKSFSVSKTLPILPIGKIDKKTLAKEFS